MQLVKIKADIMREYGARDRVVHACMCHSMMGTWYRVRCMEVGVVSVSAWLPAATAPVLEAAAASD